MKIETLYRTPWVALRRVSDPKRGIQGYDYLHESRSNGQIVAVLPYRRTRPFHYPASVGLTTPDAFEILLRLETTPCWGLNNDGDPEPALSSITGGVEPGQSANRTARHELFEEAGYAAEAQDFVALGTCRGTKSSDTLYYLFTVDLTGVPQTGDAGGDGSELERLATCRWFNLADVTSGVVLEIQDPLVAMLVLRLFRR